MSYCINILAVVPDSEASEGIVSRLEAFGARVHMAPDCLAAMAIVKAECLDLVVLADGACQFDLADTTRVLKSLRTDRYLPVLAIVEKGLSAERRQSLLGAGIDEVLIAPHTEEVLQYRLHAALRLRSLHEQLQEVRGELDKTLARETALLRQLREDNRALKVRSITDGLTSLYNFRYLMEWLKTEFKISQRYGHELSMLIVDLDHFKSLNDEFGHPFGDLALKEVAVILRQCARESDLVARYAGDEFALVCPRTGHKEIQALSRRILAACRKHTFSCRGKPVPLTLSLGAATYPEDPEVISPELLVFLADQALFSAERQGRDTAVAWHEIDADSRAAVRREIRGPEHPLLADDAKSRLELDAAARLVGTQAEPTSLRLAQSDLPSGPQ